MRDPRRFTTDFVGYWRGVLLLGVASTATLGLGATGQLTLYIHPRYVVFTVVMSVIALAGVVVALCLPRLADSHAEEHLAADAGEGATQSSRVHPVTPPDAVPAPRAPWLAAAASAVVVVLAAGGLLAIPPSVLSATFAGQRELNSAAKVSADEALVLAAGDASSFSVRDWAALIAGGIGDAYLRAAEPTVVGFVMADASNPELAFSVTRYAMTHCVLDVQPVAVTVRLDGWQQRVQGGQWVEVTGHFVPNPDETSDATWVLVPTSVTAIDEPADPYVY